MKKILLFILLLMPSLVLADDITKESTITLNDKAINSKIYDNNENTYISILKDDVINIKNEEDIVGIYIVYELKSAKGVITCSDKTINIGENDFLHEYINLDSIASKDINIKYDSDVKIGEITVISKGELPSNVEVWKPPYDKADIILFSTHSDDEQLFFLGLIPTYIARGANVQVVYFTNHLDNPKRLHEQLHGLYTIGVRNYPILGLIPDAWSTNLDGALKNLNKVGLSEEDALKFEVNAIRRFKPQVIVGHDELGEYSHGQHILNTYILKQAIIKANDASYEIDSFNLYGVWDTPKTYLHLYKENEITMDYDTPLPYFDGKTAYEVSKEGYSKHLSQQWTWFTAWINGKNNEYTKSTDIKTYSPNKFGLYRSLVGMDINKNDMLENITLYKDQIKEEVKEEETEEVKKEEKKISIETYIAIFCISISFILLISIIIYKRKK